MNNKDAQQEIDLVGQVAIVTGGGRGIGRAIALRLASAGAAVAAVARSPDQLAETIALIEEAGGRGIAVTADVTDQEDVERMAKEVERQLGPVDLLVNNAGHGGQIGPFWEVDPDEWWRCIAVNLRGPFLCARAVVPGMISRRRGRIINTASQAGIGLSPHLSAYAIGKTAVIRLNENIAAETKEHGISVFAIHPGGVRTAMMESAFLSDAARKWFPEIHDWMAKGGGGTPEGAADLVALLASGTADVLSGCYVSIGDDVAEMVSRAEEIRQDELYTLRLRM